MGKWLVLAGVMVIGGVVVVKAIGTAKADSINSVVGNAIDKLGELFGSAKGGAQDARDAGLPTDSLGEKPLGGSVWSTGNTWWA